MLVQKTIRAKVLHPTKRKAKLLEREYMNFQQFLRGSTDADLYSATKQQGEGLLSKLKNLKHKPKDKANLVILRRDTIRIEGQKTKLTKYWFKMPVFGVRGGIWLPIAPHSEYMKDNNIELDEVDLRETKLVKENNEWFLHITIWKEASLKNSYSSVLAVDFGHKRPAASVILKR